MGTANIFDISDANGRHGYETTVDWIENKLSAKCKPNKIIIKERRCFLGNSLTIWIYNN